MCYNDFEWRPRVASSVVEVGTLLWGLVPLVTSSPSAFSHSFLKNYKKKKVEIAAFVYTEAQGGLFLTSVTKNRAPEEQDWVHP